MAVSLAAGFKINNNEPIDNRLVLTKEQMKNAVPAGMPDVYLAVCIPDGKIYLYNKENTEDRDTGKFRLFDVDSVLANISGTSGISVSADSSGSRWVSIDTSKMEDEEALYVYNKKSAWVSLSAGQGIEISGNEIKSYLDVKYDDGLLNFQNSKITLQGE